MVESGGAGMASSCRAWLMPPGGVRQLPRGRSTRAQQVGQVGAGEAPVERPGGGVVAVLEALAAGRPGRARSAKSAGLITLRWMTEKTISIWFSHEACTGRCTSVAVGQAALIRSIERLPVVGGPVVDDPEHPPGRGVRLGGHHPLGQFVKRRDPGGGRDRADQLRPVDVIGADVGQRAVPLVLELDPAGAGRARQAARHGSGTAPEAGTSHPH